MTPYRASIVLAAVNKRSWSISSRTCRSARSRALVVAAADTSPEKRFSISSAMVLILLYFFVMLLLPS